MEVVQTIAGKQQAIGAYHSRPQSKWTKNSPSGSYFRQRVTQLASSPITKSTSPLYSSPSNTTNKLNNSGNPTVDSIFASFYKRLTEKELLGKRAKGLCFCCVDKFSLGHHCKNKSLKVLCISDDDCEKVEGNDTYMQEMAEEPIANAPESVILYILSLVGFYPHDSLTVHGKIKSKDLVVLIDSGASHNFSSDIVSELGLRWTTMVEFKVQMGNGDEVLGLGVCKGVGLRLEALEVILGFKWLAKLGDSIVNWGNLSWQVYFGGCKVKIQGNPTLCHIQVSLNYKIHTLNHEGQGVLLELHQLTQMVEEQMIVTDPTIPTAITRFLIEFQDIFELSHGLPPFAFIFDRELLVEPSIKGVCPSSKTSIGDPIVLKYGKRLYAFENYLESIATIQEQFSHSNLEDKVAL